MKTIDLVVVGAGSRGYGYAEYAVKGKKARIVGVAEPRDFHRNRMASEFDIAPENIVKDWTELVKRERFADAVIIATTDSLHEAPMLALAKKGYHILLEKPMAPSMDACQRITDAAIQNNIIFAVCHVLRYTSYTRKIKEMLDSDLVGRIIQVQHCEAVPYWHFNHSFVRGNFRKTPEAAPFLMSKSCHDIDWLRHIVGAPIKKVSSFGNRSFYRSENQPEGAADRCVNCKVEKECPFSALKLYLEMVKKGKTHWPVNMITKGEVTETSVMEALESGPYGRCVFACDNNVNDHQVVNLEFAGGATATFFMNGLRAKQGDGRKTRIFGTKGELAGNGWLLKHTDFLTDEVTEINTLSNADGTLVGGHGGGDYGLMDSFIDAVATGDQSKIITGPLETLETHMAVFAAEKSREDNQVVTL